MKIEAHYLRLDCLFLRLPLCFRVLRRFPPIIAQELPSHFGCVVLVFDGDPYLVALTYTPVGFTFAAFLFAASISSFDRVSIASTVDELGVYDISGSEIDIITEMEYCEA